jgi:hypothetical protein
MAVYAGVDTFWQAKRGIVQDGLVLNLDAGVRESYNGGDTWYDLSGNGNHGTLKNGPTFSDANGGNIVFDGTDDYVNINHSSTTNITGSITVSMLAKSNWTSSTGWNRYWSGVSKYDQFILGPNVNGKMAFLIHSGTWYPTNYNQSIWGQTNINPKEYHYYVGTYNEQTGILSLHVDGMQQYSSNIGIKTLSSDPNSFTIAKRDFSNDFLNSEIAKVEIYNRALTPQEIQQNFNVTRKRFGI